MRNNDFNKKMGGFAEKAQEISVEFSERITDYKEELGDLYKEVEAFVDDLPQGLSEEEVEMAEKFKEYLFTAYTAAIDTDEYLDAAIGIAPNVIPQI